MEADLASEEGAVGGSDEDPTALPVVDFPVVGIGASAGGLAAFEAFFSGMPAEVDPGMAFVLVQHLAPDHKSLLAELVRRYTRMPVFDVEDGMPLKINSVYIIPPNHDLALLNGSLQLLEPSAPRGQRLPIDFFFRSLALDQRARAIGIVLSGTASDGTLGVRAIKGEGGMVMAQTPESSEFDGMPRSAIATGVVDYELEPREMPARLMAYVAHAFGKLPRIVDSTLTKSDDALKKVFVLLRARTGHDFSQYKPSTIHRRIERRMAVHQLDSLAGYVRFLQQAPAEVDALFRDLLIGVTSFFRDPEAFEVLERQVIPKLFADNRSGTAIRVWSVGCSTGEEAYSIAILLQEHMESIKRSCTVQVFATDIDANAIATARAGRYPVSIAADVSPERLARFFTPDSDGGAFRINKNIRDMLVFSEQDVLRDPPFSRLDLICCRNVLIYLNLDVQKKLIPLFHYALRPGGVLFLGTSEGIGEFIDLFAPVDRKAKVFRRKDDLHAVQRAALGRFVPPTLGREVGHVGFASKTAVSPKQPLRELTEQALLRHLAPAAALVNGQGDILYLHGRTGTFLEPAPGEAAVNNVVRMAREGLRPALATALHATVLSREPAHVRGLNVKTNGHFVPVDLSIHPLATGAEVPAEAPLFLVILAESVIPVPSPENPIPGAADGGRADTEARVAALQQELRAKEEYLQNAMLELESSSEELKSSNEEMQSVNEELQSTNEELETAKEEMQSINEELATVNTELHTKVAELTRLNNDMNNLLAGTGIATVFVDQKLRILRFTPTAAQIINLIESDVGRPVGHLVANLVGYDRLVADVRSVLDTLMPVEAQVQSTSGAWFTMRIRPYRTLDNVIEGAVLTFVDVTDAVKLQEELRIARGSGG